MSRRIICIDNDGIDSLMIQYALSCDDYIITRSLEETMEHINEECEFYFYGIDSLSKNNDEFDPVEAGMNYMLLRFAHGNPIFFKTSRMFDSQNLSNCISTLYGKDDNDKGQWLRVLNVLLGAYMTFEVDNMVKTKTSENSDKNKPFVSRSDRQYALRQLILKESKDFWGTKKDKELIELLQIPKATYYRMKKQIFKEAEEEEEAQLQRLKNI